MAHSNRNDSTVFRFPYLAAIKILQLLTTFKHPGTVNALLEIQACLPQGRGRPACPREGAGNMPGVIDLSFFSRQGGRRISQGTG